VILSETYAVDRKIQLNGNVMANNNLTVNGATTLNDSTKAIGTFVSRATSAGVGMFKISYLPSNAPKKIINIYSAAGLNQLYVDSLDNWHWGATSSTLGSLNITNVPYVFEKTNSGTNLSMAYFINNRTSAVNSGGYIGVGTDDGAALGNTHVLGGYNFNSARDNAHNINNGATIYAVNNSGAAWAASDYPADLIFGTTSDGAATPTDRFKIAMTGVISQVNNTYIQDSLYTQRESSVVFPAGIITLTSAQSGFGTIFVDSSGVRLAKIYFSFQDNGVTFIDQSFTQTYITVTNTNGGGSFNVYDGGTSAIIQNSRAYSVTMRIVINYATN
jgi:hypothetical protein